MYIGFSAKDHKFYSTDDPYCAVLNDQGEPLSEPEELVDYYNVIVKIDLKGQDDYGISQSRDYILRVCKDCGRMFMISIDEYMWYLDRGYKVTRKCKRCRDKAKKIAIDNVKANIRKALDINNGILHDD